MPLVALPAAVVAAIFALLFLLAWQAWGKSISETLNFDVGVGPVSFNLFGWVGPLLDQTYALLLYWLDGLVHPIVNFILAPLSTIENAFDSVADALGDLAAFGDYTINVLAPSWINAAAGLANDVVTQLMYIQLSSLTGSVQILLERVNRFQAYLDNLQLSIQSSITQQLNSAVSTVIANLPSTAQVASIATSAANAAVNAATSGLTNLISTAYNQATAYAATLFATAEADIAAGVAAAESYAQSIALAGVGAVTTDIDNAIGGALEGIYSDLDSAIADVTGVAGDWGADVLDGINDIPLGRIADIAGVATLAGATALTLTRYLRDCGIPNCRNLSGLGNDLASLAGLVGDAAFLEFIVGLIHNPSGAGQTYQDTLGGIVDGAVSVTRELLGV